MPDLPEKLPADDALLLMYLADELPHADKVTLEARLVAEPHLRAQLESLRGARESVYAALAASDARTPLAVTEPVAVRRVARAIAQWQTDRLTAPAQPARPHRFRHHYPAWAYPTAAAAVLLIGFLAWWGNRSDLPSLATSQPSTDSPLTDNTQPDNTQPDNAQPATTDNPAAIATANPADDTLPADDATLAADLRDSLAGPTASPDADAPINHLERMQREAVALGNAIDPVLPTPDEVNP